MLTVKLLIHVFGHEPLFKHQSKKENKHNKMTYLSSKELVDERAILLNNILLSRLILFQLN